MSEEGLAKFKNIQQSYLLDVENAKYNPQSTALEIMKLKKQLQAYKGKEDKLRERIKEWLGTDNFRDDFNEGLEYAGTEILQILDGSDTSENN